MPPRLIGLYALATMERDGPIHGYRLAQRIAERTGGSWRPGAGAIYPSLGSLVERGFARREGVGRRRLYSITPAGRTALRTLRRRRRDEDKAGPDLSALWADVLGVNDPGPLLLRRLERTTASLESYLGQHADARRALATRRSALRLLARAGERLGAQPPARRRRAPA
jgi:DNA-binding PadR family transcriptional regulator